MIKDKRPYVSVNKISTAYEAVSEELTKAKVLFVLLGAYSINAVECVLRGDVKGAFGIAGVTALGAMLGGVAFSEAIAADNVLRITPSHHKNKTASDLVKGDIATAYGSLFVTGVSTIVTIENITNSVVIGTAVGVCSLAAFGLLAACKSSKTSNTLKKLYMPLFGQTHDPK